MKTDLFRFATLRTPQLISPRMKKVGYLEHPEITESFFLKSIANIDDIEKARKKVRDIHSNFNASKSVNSIKKINEQIYEFSSWLMLNKSSLTKTEVLEKKDNINELDLPLQVFLWDNIMYQIITKESAYIRQACIQMLVASNFIKLTKDEDEVKKTAKEINIPRLPLPPEVDRQVDLYLRRLANAKLIIPQALTVKKEDKVNEKYQPKHDFEYIEADFEKSYFLHKVSFLEDIKSELTSLNKEYKKDYGAALKKAMDDHDKIVENINKKYFDKIKIKGQNAEVKKNSNAGVSRELDPDDKLFLTYPEFKFEFVPPLSAKYVKGKLNTPTLELIQDQHLQDQPVEGAIEKVDRQIRSLKKQAYGTSRKPQKIIITNGNVIKENKLELYCYAMGIFLEEKIKELNNKMFMAINVGYVRAFVISGSFKLKIGNKAYNSKEINVIRNSDKTLFMELFPNEKLIVGKAQFFEINGEFELNNGVQLFFESRGYVKNKYTNGCARIVVESVVEPTDIHYGVNRIGIADYRKVEQEVCCYVPGEVSHIENILAKEYKERHTRNLTSTETTTEITSEVEIENLTDTSTTERNELHTETSSILNEDRSTSFGFSAGVSGSYAGVTVSADAYADFATSNSSSDSNSVAKTYAEDVTRRALERVVQKITEKRVSKILKEFEENNRHGFDNRNGDQHVTGIYRWVDKIYKNRLVNYGKRLMYEFLVPEPARFYRTAITTILDSEEETPELPTVIKVPPTPEELGFSGPGDITDENYQGFAAAYDVSLDTPPKPNDFISHSVSVKPDPDAKPFSYPINDLIIPTGYEAIVASASMTFVYDRATVGGPEAEFVMNLGGQKFSKTYKNRDQTTKNLQNDFVFSNPIRTKVSGSISGDKIKSAGADIVVFVERTDEVYDEWKNKVYDALKAAYNAKLQEYNAELEAAGLNEDSETEQPKSNPKFNRIIEKREIKRICIEMLARPFNIPVGKDFYRTVTPCGENNPTEIHRVEQNPSFERYTSHVKFFEQAFDWEIMSYLFYPYYWADQCKWIELFQSKDTNDPIFQSFLQSGMARVIVPVRVGFEEAVSYFMETGEIWNGGGLVLDSESDLYISIVEEMQEIEGFVEEEWQTTVPTSLTIVQNQSAQLEEGGLPCCEEIEGAATLKASDVKINIPES